MNFARDYLLHNIVDPSTEIPNACPSSILEFKDGRTIVGIVTHADANTLSVVTANESLTVPRPELQTITQSELSMMPDGLLTGFTQDDIRDLIAYLRN